MQKNTVRLKHLRKSRASVKFVSFEPLLGPIGKVDLSGIDCGHKSAEKAVLVRGQWRKHGRWRFVIVQDLESSLLLSSSGAGFDRRQGGRS